MSVKRPTATTSVKCRTIGCDETGLHAHLYGSEATGFEWRLTDPVRHVIAVAEKGWATTLADARAEARTALEREHRHRDTYIDEVIK